MCMLHNGEGSGRDESKKENKREETSRPIRTCDKTGCIFFIAFQQAERKTSFMNLDDKTPKTTSLTWNTNEQYKFYVIIRVSLYVFNDQRELFMYIGNDSLRSDTSVDDVIGRY